MTTTTNPKHKIEVLKNEAGDPEGVHQYAIHGTDDQGVEFTLVYETATEIGHALLDLIDAVILLMRGELPNGEEEEHHGGGAI